VIPVYSLFVSRNRTPSPLLRVGKVTDKVGLLRTLKAAGPVARQAVIEYCERLLRQSRNDAARETLREIITLAKSVS
jgi:hypothetical protein